MKPNRIGKYELLDHIGHGTTANVWLAKDPDMGRQVALKVVEPETTDLEPFFKEARLLARLAHPNIVAIHGSAQIEDKVVIDMEYVPGGSLRQALQKEKPFSVNRALKIAAQILNALAYAHSAGVVHRDLKPANLLIASEDHVKVVDFGIADVLGTQGYLAGAGTFSHMAPECFLDKSDRRSDLYSVGVILYEMLTGDLPVKAERGTMTSWKEALDKKERPKPLTTFLSDAPSGLQDVVSLALAYDKQKRFQTADDFLGALKCNGFYLLPDSEEELRQIDRFEAAYNRSKVTKSRSLPPNQTTKGLNDCKKKEATDEEQPLTEADHIEAPTQRGLDEAQLERVMQELRFVPARRVILNYDANGAVHYFGISVYSSPGKIFSPPIRGTVLDPTRSLEKLFDEQREIQQELLEQQKQERIKRGLCTSCGESLGFKDKLCRRVHHDDPLCDTARFYDDHNLAECWRKARRA